MPVVRMHMDSAEALAESYDGAADQVRNAMAELSPLMTEALALLDMPGQNPVHGPTPALTETANGLDEDGADLSWRVDLLRSTDAQPLGVTGRVMAFAPNDLGSVFENAGLTQDQVELAEDMVRNGVQFAHATQAAKSSNLDTTLDRLRLTELNARIDDWSGSDNDPILDLLLAERRELETRIAERDREIDSQYAAFRRQEAKSWASPRWTPLETAEHSLTQISTILDTAKHDRGRGVGATVADGIWSTEDLETVIANEHGYYTTTQIAHAQNVLAMANSSPEARSHLGITQSGEGWTFTEVAHLTLDVFGMVPIVGNAADGINAAWYAAEGEYLDAALSSIALIPGLGQIIAPARQAIRAAANGRAFRSLDDALAWTKTWIESTGLWRFSDEGADFGSTIPRQSGAGGGFEDADFAYELIRSASTDVDLIARHSDFTPAQIADIKDHLFHREHLLDRYEDYGVPAEWSRFDSDPNIAESWSRLERGNPRPVDIELLNHELAELTYMRDTGNPSYRLAHEYAETIHPSPNYGDLP